LRSASFRPAESVGNFDDFINVDLARLLEQNSRACNIVFMLAQTNPTPTLWQKPNSSPRKNDIRMPL